MYFIWQQKWYMSAYIYICLLLPIVFSLWGMDTGLTETVNRQFIRSFTHRACACKALFLIPYVHVGPHEHEYKHEYEHGDASDNEYDYDHEHEGEYECEPE